MVLTNTWAWQLVHSESYIASLEGDGDVAALSGGGHGLTTTAPGEWYEYTVAVARGGRYLLEARVASAGCGGQFHLEIDGRPVTDRLSIPNTESWQKNFAIVRRNDVELEAGLHTLRLAELGLAVQSKALRCIWRGRHRISRHRRLDTPDTRAFTGRERICHGDRGSNERGVEHGFTSKAMDHAGARTPAQASCQEQVAL